MTFDGLIPLAQYSAPKLPTEDRLRAWSMRIKAMFLSRMGDTVISSERLETPTLRRLDEAAEPPACGPLIEDIERATADWLAADPPNPAALAIVMPPTDENDVLGSWAREAGYRVLDPPETRGAFCDRQTMASATQEPCPLLAIPRLERWFLRSETGLEGLRELFRHLENYPGRVLIGCNSFAWAFLSKALNLNLLIHEPLIFKPFDAERLERWLGGLAEDEAGRSVDFRIAETGESLLDEGDGGPESSDFFVRLAGRSRGIPWIAWHMWRNSLRLAETDAKPQADAVEPEADDAKPPVSGRLDRTTFWVAALDELVLPGDYPRDLLFALHALALHGAMRREDLAKVMPSGLDPQIVGALVNSRFVRRADNRLTLEPETYPAIYDGLRTAGFPVGQI
ncbi:MAG: hypothetical protein MK010_01060 [Erythrobacter sp.]|nr:hypothetical protein [Erythrobacter sp.]